MASEQLSNTGKLNRANWAFIGGMVLIVLAYILLHDLLGGTLFEHNNWDSYTLQAMAWRNGSFALGQNYEYLELAIYNGDWYVSFPPFPSVVMLPLTFLFGVDTPNNFVIMVVVLLAIVFAYLCFKKIGSTDIEAMFWAVFFVLGSNMLWMSTMGSVWFMAQALNLLLCFAAVFCMLVQKKALCLLLLALAVGCRPFSVCLLLVMFVLFCMHEKQKYPNKSVLWCVVRQLKYLIAPAVIAGVYLWYNYARFGDPLEFGHNYLPEFMAVDSAQFSAKYIPENLYRFFVRPVTITQAGRLTFPLFDGFMFYIANPIFLVWFIYLVKDIVKKQFTWEKAVLCGGFAANMLLLIAHKTLGGWQFGARYTVDLIPFVLLYLLVIKAKKPNGVDVFLGCFALLFNIYGMLYMHFVNV